MTKIVVANSGGARIAKLVEVDIASGAELTFVADRGATTSVFFDQRTFDALSPRPAAHRLELNPGEPMTLKFGDIGEGAYILTLQSPQLPPPSPEASQGPTGGRPVLVIKGATGASFPAPGFDPQQLPIGDPLPGDGGNN